MSTQSHASRAPFWKNYRTVNDPQLGNIRYKKVADATAKELNNSLKAKTISGGSSDNTVNYSIYDAFNEFGAGSAPPFTNAMGANNGIDVYRLSYKTWSPDSGKTYRVSGLLSVPRYSRQSERADVNLPLVSWQHGTELFPQDAPTNLFKKDKIQYDSFGQPFSAETLFNLVKLGGNGFAVAAADYIGNGESKPTQAYWIKDTTVQTTQDMIKASKTVMRTLGFESENIFLNGWSQGGLNTQWLANSLEEEGTPAEKIAVASGPSDLNKLLQYWVNSYPGTPTWLTSASPLLYGSYQKFYGIKRLLTKAIKKEYLQTSENIYNKAYSPEDFLRLELPVLPKELLTDKIIGRINNGSGDFVDKIINNTALQGKYSSPSVFYGGDGDTVVPPLNSITAPVEHQQSLGSNLSIGINFGPNATHRSTFLSSLFDKEFNTLDFFQDPSF